MALLVPLLRSASHRDTYERSLALPVTRRCTTPTFAPLLGRRGRPRCARPLRAALSRVPPRRLPAPPGFVIGSPRPAASLRFAPGHVRALADAAGRPPLYVALRSLRSSGGATPAQGSERLRLKEDRHSCVFAGNRTPALARMCGGRAAAVSERRAGSRRSGIGLNAARGGRAQRGRPDRPRSGAIVGPRTTAGDR